VILSAINKGVQLLETQSDSFEALETIAEMSLIRDLLIGVEKVSDQS
jgi:hypothetical protein